MFGLQSFNLKMVVNDAVKSTVGMKTLTQNDFNILQPLSLMQQGLPAGYDFADYIIVPYNKENKEINLKACNLDSISGLQVNDFKLGLAEIIHNNNRDYHPSPKFKVAELPQLLICAFDTWVWNKINSDNPVQTYKPIWDDENRKGQLPPYFKPRKKIFYKFNTAMFFQVKKMIGNTKNEKGQLVRNTLSLQLLDLLSKHKLQYRIQQGSSRHFCGFDNAIIAGRFNDGVEKPKDPYSFYLDCLIGYDRPSHVAGSYLVMQQCSFDWHSIHNSSENMAGVIGRNQIKDGSNIFSQLHCPKSHIRLSRVKDEQGNAVNLHRQSKTFVSSSFCSHNFRHNTNNLTPEQGIFFMGYHRNPLILEKIILNQLGLNNESQFDDGLLNHFRVNNGNILYVPNLYELTGAAIQRQKVGDTIISLCNYHQINWLKNYKLNEEDEELHKITGNPYFHYSRMGYLKKMSYAQEVMPHLNPPSARTLRILSRTFTLWQDTWYYDRRQVQIEHFLHFLNQKHLQPSYKQLEEATGYKFLNLKSGQKWVEADIKKIPVTLRNGICKYLELGHVFSTKKYGCRGPVNGRSDGVFGGNTFHLQPEDVLAGGMTNLSMGQGKHLIDYMTEDEKQSNWLIGKNLSAHSGIGHIVPHYDEIIQFGLKEVIQRFKKAANNAANENNVDAAKKKKKQELFLGSVLSLLGLREYFLNYAKLAQDLANSQGVQQKASRQSLETIAKNMKHLADHPPTNFHQGVQLVLSVYLALHLCGEDVSIGRLDYVLRKWGKNLDPNATSYQADQFEQDIVDSLFIKIGEKVNFNRNTFEDHQKWGNLALGNNAGPYPQGASFNQWGQQLTVGGSYPILQNGKVVGEKPFYNSITLYALRSARLIPFNAPQLGFRVVPDTPKFLIEESAKSILSGGAHPVLMNDEKIVYSMIKCGSYNIQQAWKKHKYFENGVEVDVPHELWNTTVKPQHAYDYCSDGCHEMLFAGRCWFSLGIGRCTLEPLEYVLNEGKSLLDSGSRFIGGKRNTYRERPLDTMKTYKEFEDQFFATFKEFIRKDTTMSLGSHGAATAWCPANLLNPFVANFRQRASDFYENGPQYKVFAPQYTGIANLVNSLWNIKTLVYEKGETTLDEVRRILQINWGDEMVEPFVSRTVFPNFKERYAIRCQTLRKIVWEQPKFGVDPEVSRFGLRIAKTLSDIVKDVFQNPDAGLLNTYKKLAKTFGTKQHPFGIVYMPGAASFAGFVDNGFNVGASFDGRKRFQSIAQDFSTQNLMMDIAPGNKSFRFEPIEFQKLLDNYSHKPGGELDPQMHSGAVLDFNIDENYSLPCLTRNIASFAKGKGPNIITITTCDRSHIQELLTNTDRDLLRFRMGGWTEMGVSMFPMLIEQHVRRIRVIPDREEKHEEKDKLKH